MRKPLITPCEDWFFDPAASVSETDRAVRAEHLASCPRCAAQSERDAALTSLWEATRPTEPGETAWEPVWTCVSEHLDRAEAPEPVIVTTLSASPWRHRAMSASLVAQAAAILGALVLWGAHRRPTEAPALSSNLTAPAHAPRVDVDIDIEPGEVVMIHLEGNTVQAVPMSHEDQRPDTLDENLVLFNDAEAMAGMQETIAEMHHHVDAEPPG